MNLDLALRKSIEHFIFEAFGSALKSRCDFLDALNAVTLEEIELSSKRLHVFLSSSAQNPIKILLDLYEALQLKKFLLLFNAKANFVACMQPLDMIIIVCGPKELTLNIVESLEIAHKPNFIPLSFDGNSADISPKLKFLSPQIYSDISLEQFVYTSNVPKIMKGLMDHWPALVKWSNPNYFLDVMGHRLVPIELGSSYLNSDWTQKIMSMEVFLKDYVCTENPDNVAYLAQYDLLSAIPSLQSDVDDLDFCYAELPDTRAQIARNIWLGMRNCYTPLHFDKYHNLFCQVAGRKHIRLLSPESLVTANILGNTLQIDIETVLNDPIISSSVLEMVLNPGEVLFIPKNWWHEVRSLSSYSVSISHWF